MNNTAIIVKIENLRPVPNADNIIQGTVLGYYNVIVSKNTLNNTIGIYFDCGLVLSEEYCKENNLYRNSSLNKDINKSGYIEENRRIKAMKFKGVRSDGLFMDISTLDYIQKEINLKEGSEFTELNGRLVCEKYITKKTREKGQKNKTKNKNENKFKISKDVFPEHFDTEYLIKHVHEIPDNVKLIITAKIHGSSGRFSLTKIGVKPSKFKYYLGSILNKFGLYLDFSEYKEVVGSRRVVKTNNLTSQSFYKTDIWQKAFDKYFKGKLRKNEMIYCEIVGYESEDSPLMGTYSVDKIGKEYVKQYGKQMIFSYKCSPGEFDVYVYRISLLNLDGYQYDYSWEDVKRRCNEIGVKYVPEIAVLNSKDFFEDKRKLVDYIDSLCDKPSIIDNRHLEEGFCVRVEDNLSDLKIYKHKGFLYKVLEGIIKENPDFVDIEESN